MAISYTRQWKRVGVNNAEVGDYLTICMDQGQPPLKHLSLPMLPGERKTGSGFHTPNWESDSLYANDIAGENEEIVLITPAIPALMLKSFTAHLKTDCSNAVALAVRWGSRLAVNGYDIDTDYKIDITPVLASDALSAWRPAAPFVGHPVSSIEGTTNKATAIHGPQCMGGDIPSLPYFQIIGTLGGTESEKSIWCQIFAEYK